MCQINPMCFPMRYLTKLILNFLFLLYINMIDAQNIENIYPNEVGDIAFDAKIDNPNFKICNPGISLQYYNFSKGFQYSGEKYEILKLWNKVNNPNIKSSLNGYITIRFLVNCEGKTGLFRIQQMDENYNEILFEEDIQSELLKFIKSLNSWTPLIYKGKKMDYYQYLTFKMKDGIVQEILP